jgi:hypothetical protein
VGGHGVDAAASDRADVCVADRLAVELDHGRHLEVALVVPGDVRAHTRTVGQHDLDILLRRDERDAECRARAEVGPQQTGFEVVDQQPVTRGAREQ